jgi:hypothetical protein
LAHHTHLCLIHMSFEVCPLSHYGNHQVSCVAVINKVQKIFSVFSGYFQHRLFSRFRYAHITFVTCLL